MNGSIGIEGNRANDLLSHSKTYEGEMEEANTVAAILKALNFAANSHRDVLEQELVLACFREFQEVRGEW